MVIVITFVFEKADNFLEEGNRALRNFEESKKQKRPVKQISETREIRSSLLVCQKDWYVWETYTCQPQDY